MEFVLIVYQLKIFSCKLLNHIFKQCKQLFRMKEFSYQFSQMFLFINSTKVMLILTFIQILGAPPPHTQIKFIKFMPQNNDPY